MSVGETGQIIGETGVGETGVGEMGVNLDSNGFLEAVDMDKLPILSRNYLKWPLNLKNIFNFEN